MTTPDTTPDPDTFVEIIIQDPTTNEFHTFTGTTEDEAAAAAEEYFGVNEAQEREND